MQVHYMCSMSLDVDSSRAETHKLTYSKLWVWSVQAPPYPNCLQWSHLLSITLIISLSPQVIFYQTLDILTFPASSLSLL